METSNPSEIKQLFASPIGQSMWNTLNSEAGIASLLAAAQTGQPVEFAVYDMLFEEWEDEINNSEVYELIKGMVQHVMHGLGYTLIERTLRSYKRQEPVFSSRYKITRHKPSFMDIIDVGKSHIFKDNKNWLQKKDTNNAIFDMFFDEPKEVVEITGKAVFEEFDTKDCEPPMDRNIFEPGSAFTILCDLPTGEIYLRIRYYYMAVLDKCLGKTTQEQEVILFRENKQFPLLPGHIENSDASIRSMTLYPTDEDLRDLADKILSGILKYAFHAKDEYGVMMSQYAKTLKRRL